MNVGKSPCLGTRLPPKERGGGHQMVALDVKQNSKEVEIFFDVQ